jgi:hypothetical protein
LSRLSLQTTSGLFVLLAGLAVVYAVAVAPGSDSPVPRKFVAPGASVTIAVPPPGLEGVGPAAQRVLYASGKARAVRVEDLSELAPEVARVLASYGATLAVPVNQGGGG